jgi:mitochondrial fission protein ELM1
MDRPDTWVLTDGRAGNRVAALGLAEALGRDVRGIEIALARPWRWLPPRAWPPGVLGVTRPVVGDLAPPYPSLIISCGRKAVGPALELKRRAKGATVAVHIQNPRVGPGRFDLIAAPAHDRLSGPEVEVTIGSVHGLTRAKLDAAAEAWRDRLAFLPSPRVAVLIGGSNAAYRLDAAEGRRIGALVARVAEETGAGLMITASRRTDPSAEAALRAALSGPNVAFWDGEGDNPYRGYLGLADHVLVTGDSVNMVSEAVATRRPTQVIALPVAGRSAKFERFHVAMRDAGATRPFEGTLETWAVTPPDDTERVAARVRALLENRV